ncbi:glycosyltransferase family 2 protein [Agromyces aurantiacus]|uniref:Glycosyltransferase family 2 protein n=1 Tax=Agromyces aurantiacus TaxID=165814 RepID=A0ABV9R3Q1_9MICO|nr:glycosyltransferase family A protein [Agromyces aurantiacus]MBM7502745.1 glycosyltransferase involved in cell wall biosynthesis [Agromyces aurantiacus]
MTSQPTDLRPDARDAQPLVTIVIPLYDGGRFIRQTLESVLAQGFARLEVVVVDDGSTDDGPAIVRELAADPRVALVTSPHLGVCEARNLGATRAAASSRYLLFLDADDVWHPDTLATLIEVLENRPDAAGAFVLADYVDAEGAPLHPGDFPRHMRSREDLVEGRLVPRDLDADVGAEHLFLANLVYPPSCLLIRRSAFDRAGGFDSRFLAEDWEFVVRLAEVGPLVPVDRVMVGYRRHASNASGDRARNVRGARQVWSAVYHRRSGSPDADRRIRRIWRAHQARVARRKLGEGRAMIARGQVLAGLARVTDGMAHALLRWPPRAWAPHRERASGLES